MKRSYSRLGALWLALGALALMALGLWLAEPATIALRQQWDLPSVITPLAVGMLAGSLALVARGRRKIRLSTLVVACVVLALSVAILWLGPMIFPNGTQGYLWMRVPQGCALLVGLALTSSLCGGGGRWWQVLAMIALTWAVQMTLMQLARQPMFEPFDRQRMIAIGALYDFLMVPLCMAGGALMLPIGLGNPQPRWLAVALGALGGVAGAVFMVSAIVHGFFLNVSNEGFAYWLPRVMIEHLGLMLMLYVFSGAFLRVAIEGFRKQPPDATQS